MSLKSELEEFLKNYNKLAILGIGNELRGDDGVGPYIVNSLEEKFNNFENSKNSNHLLFIDAGSVPENFTGHLKKEKPSHIIIIDTVLMEKDPGLIKIVKKDEIASINVSTHSMSLSYLIKYLEKDIEFKLLFIGIQPLYMNLGEELSYEVIKSAEYIKDIIAYLI